MTAKGMGFGGMEHMMAGEDRKLHLKMLCEFGMTPGGGLRDACLWAADEIERLTKELAVQKGVVDIVYIPVRDLAEKNERLRADLAHKEAYYAQFDLTPKSVPETPG